MRKTILFNDNWHFIRKGAEMTVTLPHTWNAKDGTDGGNDYWRGTAVYTKSFAKPDMHADERVYIEFQGAAMIADVRLNGIELCHHEGGYSTFRADMTDALQERNLLVVSVDNSENDRVYPQKADFTFYGGLYRDVKLIVVPDEHFEIQDAGTPGIHVSSVLSEKLDSAVVTVKTLHNAKRVSIAVNGETKTVKDTAEFTIKQPRLWNGKKIPTYIYRHGQA